MAELRAKRTNEQSRNCEKRGKSEWEKPHCELAAKVVISGSTWRNFAVVCTKFRFKSLLLDGVYNYILFGNQLFNEIVFKESIVLFCSSNNQFSFLDSKVNKIWFKKFAKNWTFYEIHFEFCCFDLEKIFCILVSKIATKF